MKKTKMYCLLCAELKSQKILKNLQDDEEMSFKIINQLLRFNLVLEFHNVLPKTVCNLCIKRLEQAFTFILAVEKAQALLGDFTLIDTSQYQCDTGARKIICDPPLPSNQDIDNEPEIKFEHNIEDKNFNEKNDYEYEEKYPNNYLKHEENISEDEYNNVAKNYLTNNDRHCKFSDSNYTEQIEETRSNTSNKDHFNNEINVYMELESNSEVKNETKEHLNGESTPHTLLESAEVQEYINKQMKNLSDIPLQYNKLSWKDYEWRCSYCETLFPSLDSVQEHSIQFHNACNPHQCTVCNMQKLRLDRFLKHVRTHKRFLHYSCYRCCMKFEHPEHTRRHVRKIHKNSKHLCPGCNTTFPNNNELKEHVNRLFKNKWERKILKKNADGKYVCNICSKSYKGKESYKYHLLSHENKLEFSCDKCGKSFTNKGSLNAHMLVHNKTRLFQCEICKHNFKSLITLRYHASVHSGLKPYTCDVCGKSFRLKTYIANHMQSHTGALPFSCSECSKKFRTKEFLRNHMRQHTGAKPYSCEVCSREFTNWSNCGKHMRRKHGREIAKTKKTELGPHPVDPSTGKIIYPDEQQFLAWKQKMNEPIQPKKAGRQKTVIRNCK